MKQRDNMNEQLKWQERKCYRASLKAKGKKIKYFNFIGFSLFLCDHPPLFHFLPPLLREDCVRVQKNSHVKVRVKGATIIHERFETFYLAQNDNDKNNFLSPIHPNSECKIHHQPAAL